MLYAILPDWPTLLAFSAAGILLALTPGPDMLLFLGRTLSGGRRAGFAAMLGAATGLLVHTLLAAAGLSALLAASSDAYRALKFAGAAYLLWLAVQAIRGGGGLSVRPGRIEPLPRTYLTGLGINLLNPKIVAFFVTFLPQFVAAGDPQAGAKLLFLGLFFVTCLGMPVCSALILGAERLTGLVRRRPRVGRIMDYLFASLMGAFAARLLLTR